MTMTITKKWTNSAGILAVSLCFYILHLEDGTKAEAGIGTDHNFAKLVSYCGCLSGCDLGAPQHSVASCNLHLFNNLITSAHQRSRVWLTVAFHKYGFRSSTAVPDAGCPGTGLRGTPQHFSGWWLIRTERGLLLYPWYHWFAVCRSSERCLRRAGHTISDHV